ncbi:hypothetical protein PACTADRAFT_60785 [Pachysolen tannophilus NRRL Y-2460]|uniref:Phospholipid:diacylglycerol acyltransferase n=1 Tax=Pachysolen tannophilus NRRL Y-2460 TaxID=669874 RepID=A0A1E4TRV4_PACTA|nr:hypothetical protein PACTADRAFT_60785 [Pachysolen tannophilus NRRL Y-2460]
MGFAIYYGANSNPDLIPDLDTLVNFDTVNGYLEDWRDVLPASLQGILNDAADSGSMRATTESFSVGKYLKEERNLTYKYPIVMVPGVISTGIESWGLEGTPECPSEPHFRKRLWGSFYMLRTMVLDKTCWLKHIMLDPETGLDPPGITLRAAQGFEASDFFMAGYWIWNKVLQNLAVIGYGPNNMVSASYDWRLSYLDLERRDGYFSKLKAQIEMHKKIGGEKSVLFSHSMGSQVIFYFMQWVEAEGEHYGNGGSTWVNDHIAAFVDISGSVLGTPKALVALLSGEMKDTVALNTLGVKGLEKFFSRRERVDMLKSFGGIASMIPKGGDLIWGDMNGAPDDNIPFDVNYNNETFGKFISFKENIGIFSSKNLTMTDSIEFLLDQSPKWFKDRTLEHYSFGISKNKDELIKNKKFFNKWANPLEVPLPNAPDLKIYCIYGVGNPTERSYIYQEEQNKQVSKLNVSIAIDHTENPVALSDGDGTISLLTHAMCHKWKEEGNNIYNPGNSKVTIVEIKHQPDRFDIRGGAKTAEHVDILGSSVLNELLLIIAAGKGDEIEDKYVSPLKDIVANIDF